MNTYHQQPHSAHHQAPQTLWSAQSFLPQMPDSLEQLDLLLLTVAKTRIVQQDGIHFQSYHYFDLGLAAYVGESVIIRYDPRDMAEIHVYHNSQFIGRAICQELAGQTVSLEEVIRQRRARQRQLKVVLRDREELVAAYLKVHHEETSPTPPPPASDPSKKTLKSYFNE